MAKVMRWAVVAEFFLSPEGRWLDDFIEDPDLVFHKVIALRREDWHQAAKPRTGLAKWLRILGQAWRAFEGQPDGIIACFPQLAISVALIKRLTFRKTPLVAHNFNLGGFPGGMRQRLARFAARAIDVAIVHSPSEVASYSAYLDLPPGRVRFVPLQRGDIQLRRDEDREQPFLLAMGSAGRDYASLIAATTPRALPTLIITRADIIAGLSPAPAHVTFRHGVSADECLALLARARLTVVPIRNLVTASGQVTFINAMLLGTPVVATDCPGTEGYLEDGKTGLLVPPFDVEALRRAIELLWDDAGRREDLASAAQGFARETLSDTGAARALQTLLHEFQAG